MIKYVRRILQALVKEKTLNDDQLQTFFFEAEAILNARPLTPVTLDVNGETPLTPNHLRINAVARMPSARTHMLQIVFLNKDGGMLSFWLISSEKNGHVSTYVPPSHPRSCTS